MLFRNLKHKKGTAHQVTLADVHMPVRLGHRDADKLFANPLKDQLAAAALGTVMGCMRRKRANGEIIGVDLYLGLRRPGRASLEAVAEMLEALSAPFGSSIRFSDAPGTPLLFGRTEGLELAIANDLAPDGDTRRALAEICRTAIANIGVNRGWVEQEGQTRFFFYGEDFAAMKQDLARVLSNHPQFSDASLRRLA
ncbi:MAG: hypothetical protein AAFY31_06985 [Pseudomonadota bacterium]